MGEGGVYTGGPGDCCLQVTRKRAGRDRRACGQYRRGLERGGYGTVSAWEAEPRDLRFAHGGSARAVRWGYSNPTQESGYRAAGDAGGTGDVAGGGRCGGTESVSGDGARARIGAARALSR